MWLSLQNSEFRVGTEANEDTKRVKVIKTANKCSFALHTHTHTQMKKLKSHCTLSLTNIRACKPTYVYAYIHTYAGATYA